MNILRAGEFSEFGVHAYSSGPTLETTDGRRLVKLDWRETRILLAEIQAAIKEQSERETAAVEERYHTTQAVSNSLARRRRAKKSPRGVGWPSL